MASPLLALDFSACKRCRRFNGRIRLFFCQRCGRLPNDQRRSHWHLGLANFLPRVKTLGEKLGPILFQLPPRWHCNLDRLSAFLAALPAGQRYGFELRDPSWHVPAVYDLLSRYNVAFCIYELSGFQSPMEITADFAYVRLHGPHGAYRGNYEPALLSAWARRIQEWRGVLKSIYVYFDNDQAGFAARNAMALKNSLSETFKLSNR